MRHISKLYALLFVVLAVPNIYAQSFRNRGFQVPALNAGEWLNPPEDPRVVWQGANSWGIANGVSSWGMVGAQDSTQYAFLQNHGTIYQDVDGFVPGKYYQVAFWMARRNGWVGGNTGTEVTVLLDDTLTLFDAVAPTDDGQWNKYVCYTFRAEKNTYRIRWQGTYIDGTDRTSLIDKVSVNETVAPTIGQEAFINRSFELPALGANTWQAKPSSPKLAWRGTGTWGIANGVTPWGDAAAVGSQGAFLQCLGGPASIYQTVGGLTPGQLYRLRFYIAKRTGTVGGEGVGLSVLMDDVYTVLMPTAPNANGSWRIQYSGIFRAYQAEHTFRWLTDPWNGVDRTSLVDAVSIAKVSDSPTASADDGDFEFPILDSQTYVLAPNLGVSSWSGTNEWGIANGKTPYGATGEGSAQYGFVRSTLDQGAASMTATLKDLIPGQSYRLRFSMAKKALKTANPLKVLLEGKTVILGLTAPSSAVWSSYFTDVFTATSVEHRVTFQGAYATPEKPTRLTDLDNVTVELVVG